MKCFVVFALLCGILLWVPPAQAEFPVGYVNADNYSYAGNGVWSLNGQSYTRSLYQDVGYWNCGSYYAGKYYYRYKEYTPPASYTPPALPSYDDPNFENKLLDIAKQRDLFEGQNRLHALKHATRIELVRAMGLEGNWKWNGYGTAPPYPSGSLGGSYQQYQQRQMPYELTYTNYGVQANTQYGYSYNTIAQLYGTTDLNQLFQQAAQLTAGAQKLSGDATTGFHGLVGAEGEKRAKVAEILARGQMADQVIRALTAPGELSKGYSLKVGPGPTIEKQDDQVAPEVKLQTRTQWENLVVSKCASCHGKVDATGKTQKPKGGFDIALYPSMAPDAKMTVWRHLTTDVLKDRMPRNADNTPGTKLTPEELKLFFLN